MARWLIVVAIALLLGLGLVGRLFTPEPPLPKPPAPAAPADAIAVERGEPAPAREPETGEPETAAAAAAPTRRSAVRAQLEQSLAEHFPSHKLSSDQLETATDALLRVRAARLELNATPRQPEHAERIRALTAELRQAAEDFEYVVGVDPITFTERASGGFDEDEEEESG